eukprot:SAG22_NODE_842_length_6892_cov_10.369645_4_plen_93_part_00
MPARPCARARARGPRASPREPFCFSSLACAELKTNSLSPPQVATDPVLALSWGFGALGILLPFFMRTDSSLKAKAVEDAQKAERLLVHQGGV